MSPEMDFPFELKYDMILDRRMAEEERQRRIKYARHELFVTLGDSIPNDLPVVIEVTVKRELMLADTMRNGCFYSEGDETVRLRVSVKKLA